jgi:peptidyl-prolyl cis-trans isomerase A (cyclophilin A)
MSFFIGAALMAGYEKAAAAQDSWRKTNGLFAVIETSKGTIVCKLYEDKAPKTVNNFVGLATGTKSWFDIAKGQKLTTKFYDGLTFHRVIPGFMIQGGDPEGTGRGGPGYKFEDEIDQSLKFDRPGLLAMANSGPNTNGSQFFITVGKAEHLNGRHTIFGEVVQGYEIAEQIAKVPKDSSDKPFEPVVIKSVKIERTLAPGTYATIETSMGNITFQLYLDKAPKTCAVFIGLAEGTMEWTDPKTKEKVTRPLYDGTIIHRIVPGYVVQGGDPLGTGEGNPIPGYGLEVTEDLKYDRAGRVGMAREEDPNTNGCQFFITLAPTEKLNMNYTIFGQVVEGFDVLSAMEKLERDAANDRPKNPPVIKSVKIKKVE